ncbi:MAG: hypothetical protein Q8O74_00850, partial [bacterium]|nr:hypothetical protein [bacterium]
CQQDGKHFLGHGWLPHLFVNSPSFPAIRQVLQGIDFKNRTLILFTTIQPQNAQRSQNIYSKNILTIPFIF